MGPGGIAAIKVVGSLLGGLLGRNKQTVISAGDNFRSHMDGVMDSAAKYGFSPLALAGVNAGQGTIIPGDNSSMGAGIADAAMFLGDALSKKTDAAKLQEVSAQRDRLQSQVETLTIRPKVPGIFPAFRLGTPRAGTPATVSTGVVPAGPAAGDVRPLSSRDSGAFADPRRDVDNQDVKSHPGYIMVDNPTFGMPLRVPTLDGDEPLHWYDYPDLALTGAVAAKDFLDSPAFGPPEGYASDGQPLGPPAPRVSPKPKRRPVPITLRGPSASEMRTWLQ